MRQKAAHVPCPSPDPRAALTLWASSVCNLSPEALEGAFEWLQKGLRQPYRRI